ncbi:MAG: AI-2E family transporter [Promicromonosporaceae bacterium]|nr:AI-2E family transporter [Promicromonosporaceae bacterium]
MDETTHTPPMVEPVETTEAPTSSCAKGAQRLESQDSVPNTPEHSGFRDSLSLARNDREATKLRRGRDRTVVVFEPRNVWRTGLTVLTLIALATAVMAVLSAGSGLLFTIFMAWFVSLAIEPAVKRLATRMPRGAATGLVMAGLILAIAAFVGLFGNLVISQIATFIENIPNIVDTVLSWLENQFGFTYTLDDLFSDLQAHVGDAASLAATIAGGIISALTTLMGAVGTLLVFCFMLFYLSADGPRLRRWIASLFPPKAQATTLIVWDTMAEKTGNYVAARAILAAVNATLSGIVFAIIGLPYWLALALWTGIIAQLIPVIGTYISIAVPVLIGLLSPNPWLGLIVLIWGILYQQVENITMEPRISARAVEVHPAVGFGSVILGTTMFGLPGALMAIPVVAMLMSLLDIYRVRYTLLDEIAEHPTDIAARERAKRRAIRRERQTA